MPRGRPKSKVGKNRRDVRVIDRKPIRPLERQKMRPWLVNLLDSGECRQLAWYKRRENLFRVLWKHAAGQTFNPDNDACLFQRWAMHTGKFYQGDRPDPKKWKANFRCALHSVPDVEEDKSLRVKRGNNAFRVYKLLEHKKQKTAVAPKKIKIEVLDSDDEYDNIAFLQHLKSTSRLDDGGLSDGYSPSHESSHSSDWELADTRNQAEVQRSPLREESEPEEEHSPLPKFEELGQFPLSSGSGSMYKPSAPVLTIEENVPSAAVDSLAFDDGQINYTLSVQQLGEDNYQIIDMGWSYEQEGRIIEEYSDSQLGHSIPDFSEVTMEDMDVDVTEEEVITSGPPVIVLDEEPETDFQEYTSIQGL
ncbi:interferon regulatory factor 1-like [Mya arenaria]|uniref:interferon regulatory factor 1-like n=1 Tax=Mya arenaria TaxID=6604 RepID=UPI0022E18A67|nr:interferon regulatory factor 1-like [Mya arenaria]